MPTPPSSPLQRYGFAIALTVVATAARVALGPAIGDRQPFATYYIALILTAWYGGLGPSILALALGGLSALFFFLAPMGEFSASEFADLIGVGLYFGVGAALIAFAEVNRITLGRLEREVAERRRAEGAIREQEAIVRGERERLRTTLASIGDAVIATDAGGRVEALNRIAEGLTGWTSVEAKGRPLEEVFRIVNEVTGDPVETPIARVLREGVVVGLANHTSLIAKDGTSRPIEDSAAPILGEGGGVAGVVLVFRDVAERRRTERRIQQSEARKAAILETALDGIVTIDHEGKVVEFNPAAEAIFGHERGDVVGREMCELIVPPSLREAHRRGMARYLATGEGPVLGRRFEIIAMRADGSEFPVELAITRISAEGPPMFTAHVRDIAERKRFERRREARLAVNEVLAGAPSIDEAVPKILRAVGEGLGWDVGGLWAVDRDDDRLHCLGVWHSPDHPADEFEAVTRRSTFPKGVGLPGRVWAGGRAAWIPDVTADPNFPRAPVAAREGLHGAFGCPISLGGEVLGVVEFFSGEVRRPDDDALEMMATLGGQIGQFLERKRAEGRLEEQTRIAETLHRIGGLLAAELDLQKVVQVVTDEATRLTGAEFGAFFYNVTDERGESFTLYTISGVPREAFSKFPMPRNTALFGPTFRGEGVVRLDDVTQDPRYGKNAPHRGMPEGHLPVRSYLAVPVASRSGEVLGGLFFGHSGVGAFAEEDERVVVGVAAHAAVAIDNARLYKEAQESGRRFRQLADAMPQIVWTARPDGYLDYYNERWYEFTGFPEGQGGDESWRPILHPDDLQRCIDRWYESVGTGRPYEIEYRFRDRRTGEYRWHLGRALPVRDESSRIVKWYGTSTDIDDRKRAEEALVEADRHKDEFLATLAHELRNPLAPIRNSLHILKSPEADRTLAEPLLEMMERQVHNMTRMVDDLMDVSRINWGKIELRREEVDLASVIRRAVEASRPLIEERRHDLGLDLPDEPIRVVGDSTRLEQVLDNLLNNAAKYTDPGGRIRLVAAREGDVAVIRVRDTGIGIEPGMLPKVFGLFIQAERRLDRSRGGLGIGLSLVRQLVQIHGGTIQVHSEGPGRGTEFVVRLPALSGAGGHPPGRLPAARPTAGPTPSRRRILVVDDNVDSARTMAVLLMRLWKQEVRVAHDGPAALEAARAFLPEVILLDIGLPGLSGYEVAERLRSQPEFAGTLLVAMTGWGQDADRRRSEEAGFDRHLVKPVDLDDLRELLADAARSGE